MNSYTRAATDNKCYNCIELKATSAQMTPNNFFFFLNYRLFLALLLQIQGTYTNLCINSSVQALTEW